MTVNRSRSTPNLCDRKRSASARLARSGVTCTHEARLGDVMRARLSSVGSAGSICGSACGHLSYDMDPDEQIQ